MAQVLVRCPTCGVEPDAKADSCAVCGWSFVEASSTDDPLVASGGGEELAEGPTRGRTVLATWRAPAVVVPGLLIIATLIAVVIARGLLAGMAPVEDFDAAGSAAFSGTLVGLMAYLLIRTARPTASVNMTRGRSCGSATVVGVGAAVFSFLVVKFVIGGDAMNAATSKPVSTEGEAWLRPFVRYTSAISSDRLLITNWSDTTIHMTRACTWAVLMGGLGFGVVYAISRDRPRAFLVAIGAALGGAVGAIATMIAFVEIPELMRGPDLNTISPVVLFPVFTAGVGIAVGAMSADRIWPEQRHHQ